jgi:hypothetical protein
MQQILQALITNCSIEDLDFSKTGVNNDAQCFFLLSDLIKKNNSLRSLSMQRINLTDNTLQYLIEPLSARLNI